MLMTKTFEAGVGEKLMIALHFGQLVCMIYDTLAEAFMVWGL